MRARQATARAMAHALLAGEPGAAGFAARLRQCLDSEAAWITQLAERAALMPRERWRRLELRTLGDWIEHNAGFLQAWASPARPEARRWILRPPEHMQRLPLGLEGLALPHLPHAGALASWLAISPGALWRLTLPSAWQRRRPLAQQHYRFQALAKLSGGMRLLEIPEPYLLGLQKKLLLGLLDLVPPHEAACGFVRGRSVLHHAATHRGKAVLLTFDLKDFFTSVHAGRVHALFATLGCSHDVARLLTQLCTTATPEPVLARLRGQGAISWQQAQQLRAAHLPQGAPTSPALANLCAFGLDMRLRALAEAFGADYSRYADDMVISGPATLRAAQPRLRRWVSCIVAEEGFALNTHKTGVHTGGGQQRVCGVVVNQTLNLPRAEFDQLKAILHRCVHHGPAAQNRQGLPHWQQHLQGRVAWARQLNPAKGQRLERLLAQINWSGIEPL
jgi:RNA-directed DNA polymerase